VLEDVGGEGGVVIPCAQSPLWGGGRACPGRGHKCFLMVEYDVSREGGDMVGCWELV